MGLSNIANLAEGVIPVLIVNTVLSMALFKNMLRSVLEAVGVTSSSSSSSYSQNMEEEEEEEEWDDLSSRRRRISVTEYKCMSSGGDSRVECCVCLCGFEANEEVSELGCKHFFHRALPRQQTYYFPSLLFHTLAP